MSTYVGALSTLLVALAGIGGTYLVHRVTAVAPDPVTSRPFLSGWQPREHALSRFHARWYPATLLFLAFDVEMLFMYPWAVVVARLGVSSAAPFRSTYPAWLQRTSIVRRERRRCVRPASCPVGLHQTFRDSPTHWTATALTLESWKWTHATQELGSGE